MSDNLWHIEMNIWGIPFDLDESVFKKISIFEKAINILDGKNPSLPADLVMQRETKIK